MNRRSSDVTSNGANRTPHDSARALRRYFPRRRWPVRGRSTSQDRAQRRRQPAHRVSAALLAATCQVGGSALASCGQELASSGRSAHDCCSTPKSVACRVTCGHSGRSRAPPRRRGSIALLRSTVGAPKPCRASLSCCARTRRSGRSCGCSAAGADANASARRDSSAESRR